MKQAIVIKNPKWEPFDKAGDAFKQIALKDKDSAVLVVRGRCKERKPLIKFAAAAAMLLFALAASAQRDITALLPATTAASTTTNTTAGTGTIGVNVDAISVFQLTVVSTNAAAAGAVTVWLDNSDNGTDWLTDQYSVAVTASGTTAASAIVRVTNSVGGKWIRVGGISNTSTGATNACTIQRFTVSQ